MAVDTRQKRFGLMNVSMPWRGTSHPLTSGIDADERAVMIFQYGGIAWSSITITDSRTVSGRVIFRFTEDSVTLRIRAIRTEGSDNLQTIANQSAMQALIYRN